MRISRPTKEPMPCSSCGRPTANLYTNNECRECRDATIANAARRMLKRMGTTRQEIAGLAQGFIATKTEEMSNAA